MNTPVNLFKARSAVRRLVALLGTIALCLGILALTPIAQASNGAARQFAVPMAAPMRAARRRRISLRARVRTTPDTEKRGEEVEQAATVAVHDLEEEGG